MIVSYFNNTRDAEPRQERTNFAAFSGKLHAFAGCHRALRADKADIECMVPASFNGRRSKANVVQRFAFTGDVDDGSVLDFDGLVSVLDGLALAYVVHSTTKSTRADHRYRVILPYAEPLTGPESEAASASIHLMLGEVFDTKTFDAGRLSIMPRWWEGAPEGVTDWSEADAHRAFKCDYHGRHLDAHAVMAAYPPPPPPIQVLPVVFGETDAADFFRLTDLATSPLVSEGMMEDYISAGEGGRFHRFMCRVAGRSFRQFGSADPQVVATLALGMNALADGKRRENVLHEAKNAIRYAAARHQHNLADTRATRVSAELERLRRRKSA